MKTHAYYLLFGCCSWFYLRGIHKRKGRFIRIGASERLLSKHVKLTAYGQFGYSYTDRKDLDVSQADNQFFGRLGMLILSGDITDKLSWMVQYELFTSQLLKLYACYKPYSFFRSR